MIKSILLAVDASENAKVAATYANFLCYKLDATLDVVYVVDSRLVNMPYWTDYGAISLPVTRFSEEMRNVLESQGKLLLEQIKEKAEHAEVRSRTEMRSGIPAAEIIEAAKDCDLIVIGRHGESSTLEDHKGLGAVAERVLRSSNQPVLVAPVKMQEIKRVLLGFDGSDRAREAMTYAAELSRRLNVPMTALSADQDEELVQERLATVRSYAEAHGLELVTMPLLNVDPVEAILGVAQEGDLIAMGAFGEGRIREWLLGSTTESVLRVAEQPVLLHR